MFTSIDDSSSATQGAPVGGDPGRASPAVTEPAGPVDEDLRASPRDCLWGPR
jgi:hypothetical protein